MASIGGKLSLHQAMANESPYVKCICGWETSGCTSWQEAGKAVDEHIAAELRQEQLRSESANALPYRSGQ